MRVGDYVRTKDGIIAKCIREECDKYVFNKIIVEDGYYYDYEYKDITPKSSNIKLVKEKPIDLIEVGDYVNGRYVDKYKGKLGNFCELPNGKWEFIELSNEHYLISSIVTKEQFSAMEYKVESEVK